MSPRLILASASPRRRQLLASLIGEFETAVADVIELDSASAGPRELVEHNARLKADWVAERHPLRAVLGADTTVCVEQTVLNKPIDLEDARRMLRLLSGRTHHVHTAICLRWPARQLTDAAVITSEVRFQRLDEATIDRYLSQVEVLDKAGAYAIQEHGDWIIESFTGSLSNIIGLPLDETASLLRRHGLL